MTKEEYNQYFREYREKNRLKIRKYNREYNKKWRKENGYHNETKWKKENNKKVRAQEHLRRKVRSGEIQRKPCVICFNKKSVAHHSDYTQPLRVIWLCAIHHKQLHLKKIKLTDG